MSTDWLENRNLKVYFTCRLAWEPDCEGLVPLDENEKPFSDTCASDVCLTREYVKDSYEVDNPRNAGKCPRAALSKLNTVFLFTGKGKHTTLHT